MEEWHCFRCNLKVEEKELTAVYMEIIRFIPGLQCPGCGAAYLTEKNVVEVVSRGEEEIEAKL